MARKVPDIALQIGAGSSIVGAIGQIGAGSSIVNGRDPRVTEIERRRVSAGWSHTELCRRAWIRKDTWQDIRSGRREPLARTLEALEKAFTEPRSKNPPQIVKAYHRIMVMDLCRHLRAPIDTVLAQDLTVQRPRNKAWLQAARINRMAIYIAAVELQVANADLARALGCTRQNIKQARDDVEDWRAADSKVERAIAVVSAKVRAQ